MNRRVDYTRPGFTPPNPLAVGRFCDCGARLDAADRECPLCPTRTEEMAEYLAASRRKA